ncbi:hypothetical protein I6E29_07215 [Arcanobacterium haemolyticum]|nr:hypothetical protein [Arcanobacterium haemolyticum]
MLVSYLVGIDVRTTRGIDTTMFGLPIEPLAIKNFIDEVVCIDAGDGVQFRCDSLDEIMEGADNQEFGCR